jgi:hypothetical protein
MRIRVRNQIQIRHPRKSFLLLSSFFRDILRTYGWLVSAHSDLVRRLYSKMTIRYLPLLCLGDFTDLSVAFFKKPKGNAFLPEKANSSDLAWKCCFF